MAFHFLPPTPIASLVLLLIALLPSAISQNLTGPGFAIAQCSLSLLPLASCASYAQGLAPTPAESCCNNLRHANSQQPGCLCLLLNSTVAGSFAINRTLALQLPLACNLQLGFSPCSGTIFHPNLTETWFRNVFNPRCLLVLQKGWQCLLAHLILKFP